MTVLKSQAQNTVHKPHPLSGSSIFFMFSDGEAQTSHHRAGTTPRRSFQGYHLGSEIWNSNRIPIPILQQLIWFYFFLFWSFCFILQMKLIYGAWQIQIKCLHFLPCCEINLCVEFVSEKEA